jgi:6-pyruvoyltetrahydropterin/6-carboxytetrahydropterin synthase
MYTITREIGIDMGHRVPTHGSKCKNMHGHRYTIQAMCSAHKLIQSGVQESMVLDFGFLKEEMMANIDHPCDHGTVFWDQDEILQTLPINMDLARSEIAYQGFRGPTTEIRGWKLYIVPFIPTAENLAKHWFERLKKRVEIASEGQAELKGVKVWETPNCTAEYFPHNGDQGR